VSTDVGVNHFWVRTSRDGDVYMECPIGGCWESIEVENDVFLILQDLLNKAEEHLTEKHGHDGE